MICLDTNALVRFFTNDDPKKALKVKKLLEKEKEILVPEVVFPELEYVLAGNYQASRKKIVEVFQFLVSQPNIKLNSRIKEAIGLFKQTKLDIADCLIAAYSLKEKNKLASFDKKLLSIKGVRGYW